MLFHLCDVSVSNFSELVNNYRIIRNELKKHKISNSEKKEIILLSKSDLLDSETICERIKLLKKITPSKILSVSSHSNIGIEQVKSVLIKEI